jgi:hypothetical protein
VSGTATNSDADAELEPPNGLEHEFAWARTEKPVLPLFQLKNGAWTMLAAPHPEAAHALEA